LDRIIIKITPDASTAVLALERGQLDVLASFEGHLKIKRLSKNPRLVMTAKGFEGPGALTWIEFNLARKPFSDLRVRQAIAYAIDKSYITGTIMGGFAQRATGPIVPGSPFYTANVEHYNLDLKKAAALLEEAGYKRGQDGMRLNVTMDAIPTFPERSKNIAEYFKAQLRKVGVNVVVRTSPDFPTWAKRMATHDFEMTVDTVFNWGDPNIGVARTYLTSNIKDIVWTNVMSYSNPKVDEILTEASHEVDFAKRKAMYTSFQKIVVHDLPILYLAVPARRNVYSKDLGDFPTNIWGLLSPLDEVYWKKQPNR
jgi:peptide/nickel transport system substrate-binding protein